MNPLASIPMLSGKGSGKAIAVIAVLLALAIAANPQASRPNKNN